jgi:hypothetical protein
MPLRAIGAFNGTLPEPTGMLIGFIRDPKKYAYLQYAQLVPAPEIQFMWCRIDPDEAVRMVDLNQFGWGYDDYRPTGKSFQISAEWLTDRTQRWDFPYTLGEATIRVWNKQGIDPKMVFDLTRSSQAGLHRAARAVAALTAGLTGAATSSLNTLLGTTGVGFNDSSGTQYDPSTGAPNANFQVIKRAFNRIKRLIHLATNGVVDRNSLYAVIPPVVAQAMSESGEMFEALKQSQFARNLTDLPDDGGAIADWNLPARYAGFNLVVEDTPRVFITKNADGTVADVTVPAQKDYILSADDIYFVSRPGGLDGGYGKQSFSTLSLFHFGGEARVQAFSESKHELVEGHVVMEDKFVTTAPVAGYKLTDVLT